MRGSTQLRMFDKRGYRCAVVRIIPFLLLFIIFISGGIIGLGEEEYDRISLLQTLATMPEHPESVPINALVPVAGTPLGDKLLAEGNAPSWHDMVRMIATARIVMPRTMVRLSAGRLEFSVEAQALMFMAGANSIFTGDTLLTTANPEFDKDKAMFALLGLQGKPPHTAPLKSPYALADVDDSSNSFVQVERYETNGVHQSANA